KQVEHHFRVLLGDIRRPGEEQHIDTIMAALAAAERALQHAQSANVRWQETALRFERQRDQARAEAVNLRGSRDHLLGVVDDVNRITQRNEHEHTTAGAVAALKTSLAIAERERDEARFDRLQWAAGEIAEREARLAEMRAVLEKIAERGCLRVEGNYSENDLVW